MTDKFNFGLDIIGNANDAWTSAISAAVNVLDAPASRVSVTPHLTFFRDSKLAALIFLTSPHPPCESVAPSPRWREPLHHSLLAAPILRGSQELAPQDEGNQ